MKYHADHTHDCDNDAPYWRSWCPVNAARRALAAQPAVPECVTPCAVCTRTTPHAYHPKPAPEAEPERCTGCGATEERFHDSNIKYHGSAWHPFTPAPR